MSNNLRFSRLLMSALTEDMRADHPKIRTRADAAVIPAGFRNQWFFEVSSGPAKGFKTYVEAGDAYEARYRGWIAWAKTNTD
jgi:hypothetical protein